MNLNQTFLSISILVGSPAVFAADTKPDYATHIAPLLRKYCVGCHNANDTEGKLNLQSFAGLMKGGAKGKILVPQNPAKSRVIGMLEGRVKPLMPPEGEKRPGKKEIALLKAWIKAGAAGPTGNSPMETLIVPNIKPTGKVRRAVHAVVVAPNGNWLAVARHRAVEILDAKTNKPLKTLVGLVGAVNDLAVSNDGKLLAAASGEPGVQGEAVVWNTKTWKPVARLKGHGDSLYAVAIGPKGKLLATGSYDRTIKLWELATVERFSKPSVKHRSNEIRQDKRKDSADGLKDRPTAIKTLRGHNGPIHDLSFHPTGKILASASGDRTVKIWDIATGKRLDTLGQPEKDQYAVAFSPDGKHIVAGGVDNRIRVWSVTQMGKEGTNPLLFARFSHEASILRLVYSPDGSRLVSSSEDRTVKLWETRKFTQLRSFKNQPDWVTGLAIAPHNNTLYLGRLDGTLAKLSVEKSAGTTIAKATPIRLTPVPKPMNAAVSRTLNEVEPNDGPKSAQKVALPASIAGVLNPAKGRRQDFDVYRFDANAGQTWILETNAARSKSPADTKIEVLHPDGSPVLRYHLRAVRDSYITFRPIDSRQTQVRVKNWEEMDLNQYLYMGGEVGRLFLAPRGPDSGFNFYANRGKRRTYFDTTATVHAKEDPVYIVEAFPAGAKLVDNGLPIFPLYFQNDDDGDRELGNDSRLTFTAPRDGEYLVRVSDTRGQGGKNFKYTLTIRPPQPDFRVTLAGAKATIAQGSGKRMTVNVDRRDGFNGEIRIDINGLPAGFTATSPIVVEADHLTSRGVINVAANVEPTVQAKSKKGKQNGKTPPRDKQTTKLMDWSKVKVTATAVINGRKVVKNVSGFGPVKVARKPKVIAWLEVDPAAKPQAAGSKEVVMAPGTTVTAMLRIERNGYKGELKFDVDHLPHGVIVDHIGLSGILIRTNETRRRIYLTAAKWVPATTRLIHAVGQGQGNPASRPIQFRIKANRKRQRPEAR